MNSFLETVLSYLVNAIPYVILILSPLKDHLRYSKKVSWSFIILFTMMEPILTVTLQITEDRKVSLTLQVIIHIFLIFIIVKENAIKLLFTILVVRNYKVIVCSGSAFIEMLWHNMSKEKNYLWGIIGTAFVLTCTMPLILTYMDRQVKPLVNSKEQGIRKAWRVLWMIPTVFHIILLDRFYGRRDNSCISTDLNREAWDFAISILINVTCLWFLYLTKYFLCQQEQNLRLLREKDQLSLMVKQCGSLQEKAQTVMRASHDIRHHMVVMNAFLKSGDEEGLRAYLEEYHFTLPEETGILVCENGVVDAIANYYIDKAKEAGIRTEVSFCIPASLPVLDSDFCSILGNLLENALEACKDMKSDQRFIRVTGYMQGSNMLILIVENSYEGEIRKSERGFLSSKRDGDGMGLASVAYYADKYAGVVKIDYNNEIFCVSVFLGFC